MLLQGFYLLDPTFFKNQSKKSKIDFSNIFKTVFIKLLNVTLQDAENEQ